MPKFVVSPVAALMGRLIDVLYLRDEIDRRGLTIPGIKKLVSTKNLDAEIARAYEQLGGPEQAAVAAFGALNQYHIWAAWEQRHIRKHPKDAEYFQHLRDKYHVGPWLGNCGVPGGRPRFRFR